MTPAKGRGILWLASYPKSGNTWLRLLLTDYFRAPSRPFDINDQGITDGNASSRAIFENTLCLPSSDLRNDEAATLRHLSLTRLVASADRDLILKVHDARLPLPDGRHMFRADVSRGAVYVLRNPLDIAVSRAFHDGHRDLDRTVAKLCDPEAEIGGGSGQQLLQRLGDWSQHVASWTEQTDIPVLVVRYEDLLADTNRVLSSIIRFSHPDVAVDAKRIAAAVETTRFDNLQSAEAEQGFSERRPRQQRFFRKGRAGDWRNHLSQQQVARIVERHHAAMARFGYLDRNGRPMDKTPDPQR